MGVSLFSMLPNNSKSFFGVSNIQIKLNKDNHSSIWTVVRLVAGGVPFGLGWQTTLTFLRKSGCLFFLGQLLVGVLCGVNSSPWPSGSFFLRYKYTMSLPVNC